MTKKSLLVFPTDGQGITNNHCNLCINKSDIVDTYRVFPMYTDEEVGGKFFLELLKASSYSNSTVIYEFKTYIVVRS